MMRIFVSNNAAFLLLVVITTIDASHIFYLPLPKIHSSHHEIKPSSIVQESVNKPTEEKSISDEFIPSSAMERDMYEKQEENERGNNFDSDTLREKEAAIKRRIIVNELSPTNLRELDYLISLDRHTRKPIKTETSNDETNEANDKLSQFHEQWIVEPAVERTARLQSNTALDGMEGRKRRNETLFLAVVGTCSLVGFVGLVAAAVFWYKIHKRAEAAIDSEYPSYGVTGPGSSGSKISPSTTMSDRKLAHSAQMFRYQEQRLQMMAQDRDHLDAKPGHSDDSDDEAPAGGDYTVYECPGLAPTGEMEVRNPLFAEPDLSSTSSTPALHPTTNSHHPQPSTSIPSSSPSKENPVS